MTWKITKEDIQKRKEKIKLERKKLSLSINLFHDEWTVKAHKNALIIVNSASGVGKTTFIRQCIKQAMFDEKRTLVFSNEEQKSQIERMIVDSLLLEDKRLTEDEAIEWLLEYCFIIDFEDTEAVEYYEKVPDLVMMGIEDYDPDLVIFDQISYCNRSESNSRKPAYEYLAQLVSEFKPYINSDQLRPPILLMQQGRSVPGAMAGESNKDATNTVNPATHVIQVFRDEEKGTWLEVQKYRYAPITGYKRYTLFEYDTKFDDFDFIKESNKYEDPKKRKGAF